VDASGAGRALEYDKSVGDADLPAQAPNRTDNLTFQKTCPANWVFLVG
jgi:hypothetical protein